MADELSIDLYLVNRKSSNGPGDGSTIFVFDVPKPLPNGITIDRTGTITFSEKKPEEVSVKYVLQTPTLSWAGKKYTVSFQPVSTQPKEHMLWATIGESKPDQQKDVPGFKDYSPTRTSVEDSMSVTIDRKQAEEPVYSYALAVNMTDEALHPTLVRDDPQIKNPPRLLDLDWILPIVIGLIIGILLSWMYGKFAFRRR